MVVTYRHHAKGFTLVEIMIVVAIIALIAAIAIPNFLRARVNANESAALASMRTLVGALEGFRSNQSPPTFPAALTDMDSTTSNPPYIDTVLSSGTKQGYTLTYTRATANTYTLTVSPVTPNVTGVRGFFTNESGVIRVAATAPATAASPPLD